MKNEFCNEFCVVFNNKGKPFVLINPSSKFKFDDFFGKGFLDLCEDLDKTFTYLFKIIKPCEIEFRGTVDRMGDILALQEYSCLMPFYTKNWQIERKDYKGEVAALFDCFTKKIEVVDNEK